MATSILAATAQAAKKPGFGAVLHENMVGLIPRLVGLYGAGATTRAATTATRRVTATEIVAATALAAVLVAPRRLILDAPKRARPIRMGAPVPTLGEGTPTEGATPDPPSVELEPPGA